MAELREDMEHIENYGTTEVSDLASVIYGSASKFGRASWDGMETLRRLSDMELELHAMHLLVVRGYSFTFKSDGVKVTILDGNSYLARDLADALYHLAGTFCIPASDENPISRTDDWPDELKKEVKNYLACQGLAPDKYENLREPATAPDVELTEVPSNWECYAWSRNQRLRCGSQQCPLKGHCTNEPLDTA